MTIEDFHVLAQNSISQDSWTRVPTDVKTIIKSPENKTTDQIFFDVHSHCFTFNHVPSGYLGVKINPPEWLLKGIGYLLIGLGYILSIGKWRQGTYWKFYSRKRFIDRFATEGTSWEIVNHHYNRCLYAFREVMKLPEPNIIMVELMMDKYRGVKGSAKQGFYQQMNELSELRNLTDWPKLSILPFFSADPRNPNVFEDFLAVFSDVDKRVNRTGQLFLNDMFPFLGLKIYPSLGYFPSDPKLMELYKVCQEKNIPITTHCGGGATRYNASDWVEGDRMVLNESDELIQESFRIDAKPKKNKSRRVARLFNAPRYWKPVLHAYPDLKLNLAHFGSDIEWENFRNGEPNTHVHEALEMIEKHPNVYADISYACSYDRNLRALMDYLEKTEDPLRSKLQSKILFGSDYYMTELKKSLITILQSVFEECDPIMIQQFCIDNPKRFLFD